MRMEFFVECPPVPKELSPNYRPASHGGAMGRALKVKRYRREVAIAARFALGGCEPPRWRSGVVAPCFYFNVSVRRRRDPDNLNGSLKAAIDCLVDAGIYLDDCAIETLHPLVVHQKVQRHYVMLICRGSKP